MKCGQLSKQVEDLRLMCGRQQEWLEIMKEKQQEQFGRSEGGNGSKSRIGNLNTSLPLNMERDENEKPPWTSFATTPNAHHTLSGLGTFTC